MMMMFIGTETLVTQLVYERSRLQANRTTRENGGDDKGNQLRDGFEPISYVLCRGPPVPSCRSDRPLPIETIL
jgi:hypothetical protein